MLELSVCIGSSCHLKGSYNIIQLFQQMMEEYALHDKIDFKANFCMKECQGGGVAVSVNGTVYHLQPEKAREFFNNTVMPALNK